MDFFMKTHGDPRTNSGPPRFLEPMVTTGLVNNTPINKVTKFSKDTGSIFFWVFYDNFKNGDPLTLTWTFNGKTALTLQREASGDFGRAYGEFFKPDKGWATGMHTITITGGGTSATATFEIIDGRTQTMSLPYEQQTVIIQGITPGSSTNATCQFSRDCPQDYACYYSACVKEYLRGSVDKTTLKWGDPVTFSGVEYTNRLKTVCFILFGPGISSEVLLSPNVISASDGQWKYIWDTSLPLSSGIQKQTGVYDTRVYLGPCDGPDYLTFRLDFTASPTTSCPQGQTMCTISMGVPSMGQQCVDQSSSLTHCGACWHSCGWGETCQNGQCIATATASCPTGQKNCGAGCINIQSDFQNCGDCGSMCSPGFGTCCSGQCLKTWTDPSNCGSCGHACLQGQTCQNGQCIAPVTSSCPTGQKNCGAGCINIQSDYLNCGDCGSICSPGFGTCCSGQCLGTWTDPSNCGSCGHACLQGQTCQNGQCVQTCTSGTTSCSGTCVNTLTDTNNCGSCGNKCSSLQYCSNGVCTATGGGIVRKTGITLPTSTIIIAPR